MLWLTLKLKDLEKLGPKKGVISQSVKDVIQSLVDDDLVFKDKIGTSVSHFNLHEKHVGINFRGFESLHISSVSTVLWFPKFWRMTKYIGIVSLFSCV